jgi:hypothetical protein
MYSAKRSGGNRYMVATRPDSGASTRRLLHHAGPESFAARTTAQRR